MKKLILAALGLIFTNQLFAVAPLIGDVADQNIAQGTSTGAQFFVVGDAETTFTSLTVTAVASDPSLLPTLTLGGTNAQRSIAVTAASGLTGTATVTLTVQDGEALTASSSFTVVVTVANTKPTLTALQGFQIISPGQTPSAVSFTVGDAETAADSLSLVATSSNTDLVPNANLTLGGSGGSRTVQVSPVAGQIGSAVIRLRVSDALGARTDGEFIFSVFDPASANNIFKQPRGLYVLDSTAGTQINGISMRDANVRNYPFVDGYVLRAGWADMDPVEGQAPNFTFISNIFTKLPAGQKLSLIVSAAATPPWLLTLPGITTWTGGNPVVTRPLPWDDIAQERLRLFLIALANHLVDGIPLRDHPRLAAINVSIPGLSHGIRDPDIRIRDIPGYSRANMKLAVLRHTANVTDNFPNVPVQMGFWTYVDNQNASFGNVTPWEQLRQEILAVHNGFNRKRIGFWMENLAANRSDAESTTWNGLPNTGFAGPLFQSQDEAFVSFQMLGAWSRPFNSNHVDNTLNGSPEDGMDYGFNTFQTRYFEVYQADVDFANMQPEFQRWHDFLAALPGPPVTVTFGSSQGGNSLSAAHGSSVNITLSASGGTAPYAWSVIGGALPFGVTLSSGGLLSGSSTQSGAHTITVQVSDATGGTATQSYTLVIEAPPSEPVWTANAARNSDGTVTLEWATTPYAWYQMEVSDDLTHWTKLGSSVQATTASMTWTDNGTQTGTHPSSAPKRFYRVRDWGIFDINFTGNSFTYSDAQRTVTGMFQRPAGTQRLPALIINHGTGGTATGFSRTRATEMSPWGLVCIGANLTHQAGQTEDLDTWGHSPENTARVRACVAALSTCSDVDLNRLAMWGHSRGAFTTIGVASEMGVELKAAGFTEGGILGDDGINDKDGQPEGSFPTISESSDITAPTLMFHVVGTPGDTVVVPSTSERLNTLLTTLGITNNRVTYDATPLGISGSAAHNIYTLPFYTEAATGVLARWRAWLITHGVLP